MRDKVRNHKIMMVALRNATENAVTSKIYRRFSGCPGTEGGGMTELLVCFSTLLLQVNVKITLYFQNFM